jgi:hypothetical protein
VKTATTKLDLLKKVGGLKGHKFKPGTSIAVIVSVPGQIGRRATLVTRKGKKATTSTGCVAPGATTTTKCPAA